MSNQNKISLKKWEESPQKFVPKTKIQDISQPIHSPVVHMIHLQKTVGNKKYVKLIFF